MDIENSMVRPTVHDPRYDIPDEDWYDESELEEEEDGEEDS